MATKSETSQASPRRTLPGELKEPRKKGKGNNSHALRRVIVGATVGTISAVGAIAARQHHIETKQPLSPAGITRDIQAIPGQVADWLNPKIEVPLTFDPNASENIVKAGVNAQPATPEQIQEFLNQTPPVFEEPKAGGFTPTIQMLLPVNLDDAKEVKIVKTYLENKGETAYYFSGNIISITGENIPFYIPLLPGAKKVGVKAEANAFGINSIDFLYYFNDGKIRGAVLNLGDRNFTPTDILKGIPQYNANVLKTKEKKDAVPTQEFDLSQNPLIDLFHVNGTAEMGFGVGNGNDSFNLSSSFATENGKALYLSPSK